MQHSLQYQLKKKFKGLTQNKTKKLIKMRNDKFMQKSKMLSQLKYAYH